MACPFLMPDAIALTHHGRVCVPTGLNLRVSPNEIFQLLALTMMLAPTFDDAQEFGMFCQKQDQIVGFATLYGTTVVVEGTKHHLDRDPLQGFANTSATCWQTVSSTA